MVICRKAVLPAGFFASGIASGIKKMPKLDAGLFFSDRPAKASCLFTANALPAAPLILCKQYLKDNKGFRGIIVNSGNANCFTGRQGIKDAEEISRHISSALGVEPGSVLVASTGIIGKKLPAEKIINAIPLLVQSLSRKGIDKAKRAIMTTDTFAKEITVKLNIGGKPISICGVAKGAGMIAPDMATLLCFIFTDANISKNALDLSLKNAAAESFNCITVDGCMSTNDSIMLLANAAAGNILITQDKYFDMFCKGLNKVCIELAKMVVRDAEGATKFVQINVNQAKSFKEAKCIALNIANSVLFKTAMFASSRNVVGRIVAATGASGIEIREEDLRIKYSPLQKKDVFIDVFLKRGDKKATVYTSDMSYEYVKINAEYN